MARRPARPAPPPARPTGPSVDALAQGSALERFLRYVAIDTQSKEDVPEVPSTKKQLELACLLADELRTMGVPLVSLDDHGYVMASIPSNLPPGHPAAGLVPKVGLIAHLDTSSAAPGGPVRPQLITYRGGDLRLPGDPTVVIRAKDNPDLGKLRGRQIVTTDGTTLLGADDKAGVAVIMTLAAELMRGPGFLHGEVRLAFTPDEVVGRGTAHFDLRRFDAEVAYTIDSDGTGELNRETFSADGATITVRGRATHPGHAKGTMVNALRVLADLIASLPMDLAPESTEGYQPFIHPHAAHGEEASATLKLLLRDFETAGLVRQRRLLKRLVAKAKRRHPGARIELAISESYRNMREGLEREPRVTQALEEAARCAGVEPRWVPIRGGTDGSRLTAMGLPTPNFFAGGYNFHGLTEWLSVDGLEASLATARQLLQTWVRLGAAGASAAAAGAGGPRPAARPRRPAPRSPAAPSRRPRGRAARAARP
jgi:tripeptide aminopeptidase